MINLYTGTPGSGKSLHVTEVIYHKLRAGINVISNFPVDDDSIKPLTKKKPKGAFICVENKELHPRALKGFAHNFHETNKGRMKEGQTLIVIDECQMMFNSRSWRDADRQAWIEFLTQHRKFGYDIILLTQYDRLIDRQMRSLVEYEYRHRKINNFKGFGSFLAMLCGGSLFIYVKIWYGINEKISSEMFRGKKKIYNLYNSYKLFDAEW